MERNGSTLETGGTSIQQPRHIKAHGDTSGIGWQARPTAIQRSPPMATFPSTLKRCVMVMPLSVSHAADELGTLGESAAEAIPLLIQALRDDYEPVRLNAAYALGAIGEPAVPQLIETLADENGPTRTDGSLRVSCSRCICCACLE